MGSIINATCEHCEASGKELSVGGGMLGSWPFEERMYVCPPCNRLVMATRPVRLSELRDVASGHENPPGPAAPGLPTDVQELARLLVKVLAWPECETCRAPLRGRGRRDEDDLDCPLCGEPLTVEQIGCWD